MSQQALTTPVVRRTAPERQHGGLALAIIVTCQLMLVLDATVMNVALPRIQADLHFSATNLSWVISAYTLTFGGLLLLGGRAGDTFGRLRMFVGGIALFTLASLLGGFAQSGAWLLIARALQGVGAAAAGPSTIALIATTFSDPRRRIRALALLSGVASGGFAIGLILGGLLTEAASWRWVLFINVPFGIAVAVLAPRFVKEPERHPAKLDIPGALIATLGIGALVYAFIHASSAGWTNTPTLVPLVAGALLLAGFLVVERRTREPIMPLWLFGDRTRAAGYVNSFLGPAAMWSMFFFLTQFLQEVRGFSALATGFAFMPMAVALFATTRVVPRLLARFGPKPLAISGALLLIAGLSWLTQLTPTSGYFSSLLAPMMIMGFAGGLTFAPLAPVIMPTVPSKDAGAAGGLLQTMQQTGTSLGLAVLVTIFGAAVRNAGHGAPTGSVLGQQALVDGMTRAFLISTIIAIAVLAVATTFPGAGARKAKAAAEARATEARSAEARSSQAVPNQAVSSQAVSSQAVSSQAVPNQAGAAEARPSEARAN